ncbi:AzlD domain-containing protein [Bacillus sp. ISL-51]|uniref:AzlD domain-containing protein n=1 Tax=unclassified Bacillus (in: firmicutes) TaxID=185979 RepID=UPI001BEA98F0|nr:MULTISPECIES: AzlD domain-containing protein [unclassified Bacillus (in: firmicutes)]MBT2574072.1 AzlD domain-containing protein [Bacillus sp. ISL-51]MBT2636024.1 AzlD domain-containing protein [Bacillus sp. ISL-26]
MSISMQMIWIILGCMIVTIVPRILPFIFVRNIQMPELALKWLSFIPLCILTALVTEGMIVKTNHALGFDWKSIIVLIPTLLCAMWTKSLSVTVITGVVLMAAVRLIW